MEEKEVKKLLVSEKVTRDKLAVSAGSGSVEVYATPMVIALMEKAAAALAQEFIEDDCTTVGTAVSIEHIAATAEGVEVFAEAELISQNGRSFEFYVTAYDNAGVIAKGTHSRFAVNSEKFLGKAKARANQE